MNIHLIGGFLGSGKTTAIIGAAKILTSDQKKVGIITNDQGKYLVDTAFFKLNNLPTTEVTGGCFCCNYQDLETLIDRMNSDLKPDVLFAESVGSCTDLVATVVKPLLKINQESNIPKSYSVFADSRLLRLFLQDAPLPFSDQVVYIFSKQIEEAGIIIVNKADLLSSEGLSIVKRLLPERFPGKQILYQNSLVESDIRIWIDFISSNEISMPNQTLTIDYEIYGSGESRMAWLDQKIIFRGDSISLENGIRSWIKDLASQLPLTGAIGHLKLLISYGNTGFKVSVTSQDSNTWDGQWKTINSDEVTVLINARIETSKDELQLITENSLEKICLAFNIEYSILHKEAFTPGFPNPTFRIQ